MHQGINFHFALFVRKMPDIQCLPGSSVYVFGLISIIHSISFGILFEADRVALFVCL